MEAQFLTKRNEANEHDPSIPHDEEIHPNTDPSKRPRPPRLDPRDLCDELSDDDGVPPRYWIDSARPSGRAVDRKQRALCREVERVVSLILDGDVADPRLAQVRVVAVRPTTGGRLCVQVTPRIASDAPDPSEVLARLSALAPYLRQEIARAVRRRRAAELTFSWQSEEEDPDGGPRDD